MNIIEITKENIEDFSERLGPDTTEDMNRWVYRGFGAVDDSGTVHGAMIYELFGVDLDGDTISRIVRLEGDSQDVKDELKSAYANNVTENKIAKSYYETPDEVMADDLVSFGFSKNAREGREVIVTLADVAKIPINIKAKLPPYVVTLGEVSVIQYRNFVKKAILKGNKGSVDDLAYLSRNWFDKSVSTCSVTHEKIKGVFLLKKTPSGVLQTKLYTAYGPEYVKTLGFLLIKAIQSGLENYPPETKIAINRHSKEVAAMTKKFLAGAKGENVFVGTKNG